MKVKHKPVEICLQKKIHFRRHIKNQARRYLTAWFFIFITSLVACAPAVTPAPTLINVQLNWVHYGPFAGLYAADQNGYYKENGISVSFQEAGVSDDPIQPVLDGIAHFGVLGADQIISARAEGTPIRAIAATFRRSPVVFVAPAESGITHPHHFAGKTIRVKHRAVSPCYDYARWCNAGRIYGNHPAVRHFTLGGW
jgi:ABC-type nitrate/sulfonate/bicarbonate transport system substrate-binding protein